VLANHDSWCRSALNLPAGCWSTRPNLRRVTAFGSVQAEDDSAALRHEPPVEFSGEEALGRYLDLHGHHMAFVNSAFGRQQDYAEYLAGLTDFDQIQRRHRTGAAYQCASAARGLTV